jgi:hypothetical protein
MHFYVAITADRILLNGGSAVSQKVAESWDQTWSIALSGGLYTALNNFGIFIAVACMTLWLLNFARKWIEEEASTPWVFTELIYPVLVVVLLSGGGNNLAQLSQGMRDALNFFNEQTIQVVANRMDLEKTMTELADYASVNAYIGNVRSQCNTITDNAKLSECLKLQNEALQGVLSVYRSKYGATLYTKRIEDQINTARRDPGEALQSGAISTVNIALSPLVSLVTLVMVALQGAFQHLIEVSMLLTAVMAPLAVGASLLPFGAKPIFAWFTAFWSLGLCKLSYNVICGLTAIAIYKTGSTETLVSAIFFGVLSPILAIAMASGGGMAIFNGILAASATVTGIAVTQVTRVAPSMGASAGAGSSAE